MEFFPVLLVTCQLRTASITSLSQLTRFSPISLVRAIADHCTWPILFALCLMTGCMSPPAVESPDEKNLRTDTGFMLSFDDGPLPEKTERVLDMLATLKATDGAPVKAAFFLLADAPEAFWQRRHYYAPFELWTGKGSIARYPEIAQRIQQSGHIIGNHSTHHAWLHWPWLNTPAAVLAEFTEWEAIATPVLGASDVRLFRPPYFIVTQNVRDTAERLGYQIVLGESAGDATPNMSVEMIKEQAATILASWSQPYPCVLVFHDIRPATYGHLDEIVAYLQQQGFRLEHFDPARL